MLITFLRAIFLYIVVLIVMRLMGKEKCTEKPENNAPGALGFVLSR